MSDTSTGADKVVVSRSLSRLAVRMIRGIAVSDAPGELVGAVIRLLRLLGRPRDRKILAPLIKREILWRLITGEHGASQFSREYRRQFGVPPSQDAERLPGPAPSAPLFLPQRRGARVLFADTAPSRACRCR
jgi:hypothetical protein